MLASLEWSQDVARHPPLQGGSFISSSLTPNVPSAGLRCSVAQQGAGSDRPLQVIWAGVQP